MKSEAEKRFERQLIAGGWLVAFGLAAAFLIVWAIVEIISYV